MDPSNGLRLDLQLSTNSSGSIYVTLDEYNTLASVNNVTAASDWAIPASNLRDVFGNYVVSYAVYQGNYGMDNFTAASPLDHNDSQMSTICPAPSPSAYYEFSPLSDKASAPAGVLAPGPTSENISASDNISGYWTGTQLSPLFTFFPPGTYTVVALDQWDDVALLHFVVQS